MEGNYHIHSTFSDGAMSIEDIAKSASVMGFDEIGIVDHYHSINYPIKYLTQETLALFIEKVSSLTDHSVRFFSGIEIDGCLGLDSLLRMTDQGISKANFIVVEHVGELREDFLNLKDFLFFARQQSCPVGLVHPKMRMLSADQHPEMTVQQLCEEKIFIDAYVKDDYPNCLNRFNIDIGEYDSYIKKYKIPIMPGTDTHACNNMQWAIGSLDLLLENGYTTLTMSTWEQVFATS